METIKGIEFYNYHGNITNHSWKDNYIFLTEDEIGKLKTTINRLLNQPINNHLGKKTYTGRLSDLPRHKIKEHFEKNNTKKTSRIEQSDTIILNKDYLIQMVNCINNDFILKKVYNIEEEKDKLWFNKKATYGYKNNLDKIHKGYRCFFTIEDYEAPINISLLNYFLTNTPYKEHYIYSYHKDPTIQEILNHLIYVTENPHVNVVFDEYLLEVINEDGFNFDEDYLSTLDSMFESKSQDNINLALEMLSNINIEQHSLTVALFLNKHIELFKWGSGLSINQNKSFKSILKYFESKNINFNSDWRIFCSYLLKLHKDNIENVKIINEFIRQNINKYLHEKCNLELNSIDINIK